jgi:YbgC/YbaW family acyl-CoA thioester hydrolase
MAYEDWQHEYRLPINEGHLDLFGHVNNAAYLEIFEEARWDWITRNGYGVREIRENGLGPVLLEARLRFHREVTNREPVLIRSRTVEYRGKIGRVEQVMTREDGTTVCSAEFVIGLFDLNARKLVKPTPEWLRAVGVEDPTGREHAMPRLESG